MPSPVITSAHNAQLRRVRSWLDRPQECRKDGVLVADGIHLVADGLAAGLRCRAVYVDTDRLGESRAAWERHADRLGETPSARVPASRPDEPPADRTGPRPGLSRDDEIRALVLAALERGAPVHPVVPRLFRSISPVETPQGIVAIFERPATSSEELPGFLATLCEGTDRRASIPVMVAAGVQDPANLGSLVRSARAAGTRAVLCTEGTVDPFHHRALRASMGAAFYLRVFTDLSAEEMLRDLARAGIRTLALSPAGGASLVEIDRRVPSAIVLGAEGRGLPPELEALLDLRVRIPMEPGVESLSVPAAGAIVLYWFYLQGR